MTDEVLTIDDAAIFMKMAPKTIRKLLKDGTLPGRQVGKQWRITKRSLLDLIDGGEAEGNAGEKRKT